MILAKLRGYLAVKMVYHTSLMHNVGRACFLNQTTYWDKCILTLSSVFPFSHFSGHRVGWGEGWGHWSPFIIIIYYYFAFCWIFMGNVSYLQKLKPIAWNLLGGWTAYFAEVLHHSIPPPCLPSCLPPSLIFPILTWLEKLLEKGERGNVPST